MLLVGLLQDDIWPLGREPHQVVQHLFLQVDWELRELCALLYPSRAPPELLLILLLCKYGCNNLLVRQILQQIEKLRLVQLLFLLLNLVDEG